MATAVLQSSDRFPAGTTVGAYLASDWVPSKRPPSGAPPGSTVTTAVVAADGSLTFTGLADGVGYYAGADVSGWRYVGFTMPPAGVSYLDATIVDAKGDLIVGTAADAVARKAVGSDGQVLTADAASAGGVKWAAGAAGGLATDTLADAKGDTFAATAADAVARVPVGTNGQVLTADSASTPGVKWATPGNMARTKTGASVYYYPVAVPTSASGPGLNFLECIPIFLSKSCTIDRINTNIGTAGGAGSVCRLGLYADDGDGFPGALLVDGGTVDSTGTGSKEVTVSVPFTGPGWLWVAMVFQVAAGALFRLQGYLQPIGVSAGGNSNNVLGSAYVQASVSGALPTPFAGDRTIATGHQCAVRVA